MSQKFIAIAPGTRVSARDKVWEIVAILREDTVVARELTSKLCEKLQISELCFDQTPALEKVEERDVTEFSDEEWTVGEARLAAVRKLLEIKHRTRDDAVRIARESGCSTSTLYRWMDTYLANGTIASLINSSPGPAPGQKKVAAEVEALIAQVIEDLYLTNKRQKPQAVVDEVKRVCRLSGITPPHPNTVRNRISALPSSLVSRRRQMQDAGKFDPIRGRFPNADFPLAVVQIDHTLGDVVLVEDTTRLPMGRPWITLAIDIYTRMVVGVYVGLNKPSALSVGLCVSKAILPKRDYLNSLGLETNWPVYGRMRILHADNAKEFGGKMLTRTCQAYQIDIRWRPIKRPKYGAHIERLMGTTAAEILKLPGATFSNVQQRKGTNPEKHAALTLEEFERHLVEWITGVYNESLHSELHASPRRKWEQALFDEDHPLPLGSLEMPQNPEKLRIDFMPFVERTVQNYGLVIHGVHYYHEVLNSWVHAPDPADSKHKQKFVVRYDPRSMGHVFFLDPETQLYHKIPYQDPTRPEVSLWEIRSAQRRLEEEGLKHIDEEAIFESIERSRKRIDEAIKKTAAARRAAQARPAKTKAAPPKEAAAPSPLLSKTQPLGDLDDGPIEAYSDLG